MTKIYIDIDAIKYNLEQIKEKVGDVAIMPIIKANAYGAGLELVGGHLIGFPFLGVVNVSEAKRLRKVNPTNAFILYQPAMQDIPQIVDSNYTIAVSEIDFLIELNKIAKNKISVHLSLDTGLGVGGLSPDMVEKFCAEVKKLKNISVKGAFTQFSAHESLDPDDIAYTNAQVEKFKSAVAAIEKTLGKLEYTHTSCSAAIITRPNEYFDLVRPGCLIHGIYPQPYFRDFINLKPVMSLCSTILSIKSMKASEPIGYARPDLGNGRASTLEQDSIVATVAIGYADGLSRSIVKDGYVIVNGQKAKIISISMNALVIDITGIKGTVKIGDEVGLFDNHLITLDEISDWCGKGFDEFISGLDSNLTRQALFTSA